MIVYATNPRFADAEDEEEYQSSRKRKLKEQAQIDENEEVMSQRNAEVEGSDAIRFNPPLYIQRYTKVTEIYEEHGFTHVADLGSAELTLIQYLKNLDFIETIIAVDLDKDLLESYKMRCKPLLVEYLNPRDEPLAITVLCGSVLDLDSRLQGLDCISAIELIEHLPIPDVEPFLHNLFGGFQPKHALISTPNKDFNVLFEFKEGQTRHWDHKFEWTREEFVEKCEYVRQKYPYDYEIFGVGDPPPDEDVGFCSQFALFSHRAPGEIARSSETVESYERLYQADFPVRDKTITDDDRLLNELVFVSRTMAQHEFLDEGIEISEIDISKVAAHYSIEQFDNVTVGRLLDLAEKSVDVGVNRETQQIVVRNTAPTSTESDSSSDDSYAQESFENVECPPVDPVDIVWEDLQGEEAW